MPILYRMKLEKIATITEEQRDCVYNAAKVFSGSLGTLELYLPLAFFNDKSYIKDRQEILTLPPGILIYLKNIAKTEDTFILRET